MADKKGKKSGNMRIRISGLALSLPVVIILLVLLISIILFVPPYLWEALFVEGSARQPHVNKLLVGIILAMGMIFILLWGIIRYIVGINTLRKRVSGIHNEQIRVDRLIEKQNTANNADMVEFDDEQRQEKYQ